MGQMTGRAAGNCTGFGMPGYANNAGGRRFGMGFGRGGGFRRRNRFFATGGPGRAGFGNMAAPFPKANPEMEKQELHYQTEVLQSEIDAIKKRLDALNAKP
jgi:hypothetical protein